ncbi:MAG: pyruvate formate-lyase 1-activating enzyme [Bacteroidetes bacterium MedPE-SWsnd-G2]|nr:MAG: pyruvate formate-lyase 1-activating enzyme [Bacteroidetes bacterium MedPE-SWsnd-G2]
MLRVHSIESMGTHDGPGIRFVVFLQGCNLNCLYCHNPDTMKTSGGTEYEIEDLVQKAIKMKSYFGKNGGVTVSGGEPLLQSKALIQFFKRLKEEGIHTNIDTNGRVLNHFTKTLLDDYTDLVMLDIKHMTEEGYEFLTKKRHKQTTFTFADYRESTGKKMWLRYVLIPEITNKPELLHALGAYFKDFNSIEKIELQPYHKLGVHKWEALGMDYELKDARENTEEELEAAENILKQYFKDVKRN